MSPHGILCSLYQIINGLMVDICCRAYIRPINYLFAFYCRIFGCYRLYMRLHMMMRVQPDEMEIRMESCSE